MLEQPLEPILQALERGRFSDLLGLHEDQHFEAKGGAPYNLDTPTGRYELAKDASSFANADGGVIVIGLEHEKKPDEAVDVVLGLQLVAPAAFNIAQYGGIIREHVYPPIQGIDIRWLEEEGRACVGLGVIRIPRQSPDLKPFLIAKMVEDGAYLKQIVAGYALRSGPDSIPLTPQQLQQSLKKGMDSQSQRLTRIEARLELLLEREAREPEPAEEVPLADRIRRILAS